MTGRDILDHQPARAETLMPGRWLLELSHDLTIVHFRRFRDVRPEEAVPVAESSSDAIRRAAAQMKAEDGLEVAWRMVNGHNANEGQVGVKEVLKSACAIVVPANKGEGSDRELWLFELRGPNDQARDGYHHEVLDQLQPIHADSFPVAELLSCATHGARASCTRDMVCESSTSCRITFRPGDRGMQWDLLTKAVVEKLSWRAGKRISMLPSSLGENNPLQATLSPFGYNQLLLRLTTPGRPFCQPSHRILRPLDLPAYHISPHHPTLEQQAHLEETFSAALGPGWSTGRSGWRLAQQALGRSTAEWSIFWVPLSTLSTDQYGKLSPTSIPRPARDTAEGIMTIWPSHLAHDPSTSIPRPTKKRKRSLAQTQPSSCSDMLNIASGLFDFFSTYKEPPPPEEVPEEPSLELVIPPVIDANGSTTKEDEKDGDDSDGLFSSRSTPNPEHVDAEGAPIYKTSQRQSQFESPPAVIIDRDVDMDADNSARPYSSKVSSVGNDEFAVTEDDFNFFDSPEKPKAADEVAAMADTNQGHEVQENGATEGVNGTDDGAGTVNGTDTGAEDGQGSPEQVLLVKDYAQEEPTSTDTRAAEAVEQPTEPLVPSDDDRPSPPGPNHKEEPPIAITSPPEDTPLLLDTATSPLVDPSPKPSDISDLIPPDFSPLPLEPLRLSTAFRKIAQPPPYQSLRSELLARLKGQYNKNTKPDYHADWRMHQDVSDDEDEDLGTDAPATPESSDMWDESTVISEQKEETAGSVEVEYDGLPCVGAEWFWLRGDDEVLGALRRKWKDAWGAIPLADGISDKAKVPIPSDGLVRMAREIICNRHYRRDRHDQTSGELDSAIAKSGTAFSDAIGQSTIVDLGSCNVHVGFAGNVMRIGITGLEFWRQLGLSPIGGEKIVTSVAVCLPGDGNMQVADSLLRGVERSWSAQRLGKHVARSQSSVIISELHSLAGTINLLLNSHVKEHLAIYILLDRSRLYDPSIMSALSSVATPPNQVVHLAPTDSLHSHHFAEIAMDVYNRMSRRMDPFTPDRLTPPTPKAAQWFQYPSFTLAPDTTPKPELNLIWPMRSYDALNRWRWVHVGYTYESEAMVGVVIDAEGENWEVGVWRQVDIAEGLEKLWVFMVTFAAKAAIEWRVAMVRLGVPTSAELAAVDRLVIRVSEPLTTLFVEPSPCVALSPRTPIPPVTISSQLMSDPSTALVDEAMNTRYGRYTHRLPVALSRSSSVPKLPNGANGAEASGIEEIYPLSSWTSTVATTGTDHLSSTYHLHSHRPAPGRGDETVQDVLVREYQKLMYLARKRFGFGDAGLPVHLEGVRAVVRGLGLAE